MKILEGVNAEQAKACPLKNRHTIWENVEHIVFWVNAVIKALQGKAMPDLQTVQDWPDTGETEEGWKDSVNKLKNRINILVEETSKFDEERLDSTVPGVKYDYRKMLHGVIHHNLYHAGQIALLK
jgi:uncharacterized damage-inducible protein DinB